MAASRGQTAYARLSPRQARAVLAVLLLAAGFCVAVTLSPLAWGNADRASQGPGDIELYRAEVARIQAGESYYQAAATELRERGYPTRSVFNWRTPLPMWLIGRLPDASLAKALLGLLALALMLTSFEALAREQVKGDSPIFAASEAFSHRHLADDATIGTVAWGRPLATVLLLSGPLMLCILGDAFVMPVLWAGVLMALSLTCRSLNRPALAVGLAVAALFVRELALPFCLLAVAIAWLTKQRRELLWWAIGLAAWGVFYGLHCLRVAELIQPGDRAHAQGWIQWAGASFVLASAQINAYLLLLPQWVTALYVAAAMCGFAGWQTPLGMRVALTACLYTIAFAVVGQEFNQYWGALTAPLWCFGVAQFPAALSDLWKAARLFRGTQPIQVFH